MGPKFQPDYMFWKGIWQIGR